MPRPMPSLLRLLLAGGLVLTLAVGSTRAATAPEATHQLPDHQGLTTQRLKFTAPDGEAADQFGFSVAMSGDVLVIGAYQNDVGQNVDQGSAYVFVRNQGGTDNWGFVKQLTANDGAAGDHFGSGVAVSGDIIIVGAYLDTVNSHTAQGSAYVFARNQGGTGHWGLVKQLTADDGAASDQFGFSVGASGDMAIVGAYGDTVGANATQGSAYVFARNQGGADQWGQAGHLFANDGTAGVSFGYAVAISGDVAVVGSQATLGGNAYQGSAYMFARNQGGTNHWGLAKQLIAGDGAAYDLFGQSVTASGEVVIIGAPGTNLNGQQGSAYVFTRNQGGADNWGFVKQLSASNSGLNGWFGGSVALDGDVLVVGARTAGNTDQGTAYLFTRNRGGPDTWGFVKQLMADDGEAYDYFGTSVTVNSDLDLVVAGALLANSASGSAYLFDQVSQPNYSIALPLVMH